MAQPDMMLTDMAQPDMMLTDMAQSDMMLTDMAQPDMATVCGDGIKSDDEMCEDGNLEDGDGCDRNCTPTACGNGIQTLGESCDDGNSTDGDGCDHNCTETACGNGIVTDGEACDDGNNADGDGCSRTCTTEAFLGMARLENWRESVENSTCDLEADCLALSQTVLNQLNDACQTAFLRAGPDVHHCSEEEVVALDISDDICSRNPLNEHVVVHDVEWLRGNTNGVGARIRCKPCNGQPQVFMNECNGEMLDIPCCRRAD